MRIRYGTLKRLVNEVALSPSVFTNNQQMKDPFDSKNITAAMQDIKRFYKSNLMMNLVLANAQLYNKETRQFDDAAHDRLDKLATSVTDQVVGKMHDAMMGGWAIASKQSKEGQSQ